MMITVTRGPSGHRRGGQDRAGCPGLRAGRERREDRAAGCRLPAVGADAGGGGGGGVSAKDGAARGPPLRQ